MNIMNKQKLYKKEQNKRRLILTIFSSKWFSFPWTYKWRIKAYKKYFNIGENPAIGFNVWISRTHGLNGTIKIGDNVVLSDNCYIDYSGHVIIKDNVVMGTDVRIISHRTDYEALREGKKINIQTNLVIEENVRIGTRAIILANCNYIGKNARIGAGAVVVEDVPDNAVVVGVPAKVIKYI